MTEKAGRGGRSTTGMRDIPNYDAYLKTVNWHQGSTDVKTPGHDIENAMENVKLPAHLIEKSKIVPPMTPESRRSRLTRRRRTRLLGASFITAGISALMAMLSMAIHSSVGFAWGSLSSVIILTFGLMALFFGGTSVSAMLDSIWRAALPAIDRDTALSTNSAFQKMTALLIQVPTADIGLQLAEHARIVVDTLMTMSDIPLKNQGMTGYPPRHTTGENPLNYEDDEMSAHVGRMRTAMLELMGHAREEELIPSTPGQVQKMIGCVAAPMRVAMRRHGLRIEGLDDGRGALQTRTVAINRMPPPKDVMDSIESLTGKSPTTEDARRQRSRIYRIGLDNLASDLAIEARALLDRHLPALERQLTAACAASIGGQDADAAAEADRMLRIIADGLRTVADAHAATVRNGMSDQRRFLESRDAPDPFGVDDARE